MLGISRVLFRGASLLGIVGNDGKYYIYIYMDYIKFSEPPISLGVQGLRACIMLQFQGVSRKHVHKVRP